MPNLPFPVNWNTMYKMFNRKQRGEWNLPHTYSSEVAAWATDGINRQQIFTLRAVIPVVAQASKTEEKKSIQYEIVFVADIKRVLIGLMLGN